MSRPDPSSRPNKRSRADLLARIKGAERLDTTWVPQALAALKLLAVCPEQIGRYAYGQYANPYPPPDLDPEIVAAERREFARLGKDRMKDAVEAHPEALTSADVPFSYRSGNAVRLAGAFAYGIILSQPDSAGVQRHEQLSSEPADPLIVDFCRHLDEQLFRMLRPLCNWDRGAERLPSEYYLDGGTQSTRCYFNARLAPLFPKLPVEHGLRTPEAVESLLRAETPLIFGPRYFRNWLTLAPFIDFWYPHWFGAMRASDVYLTLHTLKTLGDETAARQLDGWFMYLRDHQHTVLEIYHAFVAEHGNSFMISTYPSTMPWKFGVRYDDVEFPSGKRSVIEWLLTSYHMDLLQALMWSDDGFAFGGPEHWQVKARYYSIF